MLRINVPKTSYASEEITLGGQKYTFIFQFNESDERWRIDIYQAGELIIGGLKILENISLLRRHDVPAFSHGDLQCHKLLTIEEPVGRDNFGVGKAYELLYFSFEELNL